MNFVQQLLSTLCAPSHSMPSLFSKQRWLSACNAVTFFPASAGQEWQETKVWDLIESSWRSTAYSLLQQFVGSWIVLLCFGILLNTRGAVWLVTSDANASQGFLCHEVAFSQGVMDLTTRNTCAKSRVKLLSNYIELPVQVTLALITKSSGSCCMWSCKA